MTSRLQSFWSTAAWYLGGAVFIQAVNFLGQPVFALLMTPSEWGVTATYLFWMTAFGLVIGFQSPSALNNVRTTYGEERLGSYIATVLPWNALPLTLILAVLAVAPDFWSRTLGLPIGYLFLAALNGVLFAVATMAMGHALCLGRRQAYLTLSVASTLLPLVLGLPLVLLMPQDRALARILGYVVSAVAVAAVVAQRALRQRVVRDRALLSFGVAIVLPLLLHELLFLVMSQSNRVFLVTMEGAQAAGVFAFAFGVGNISVVAAAAVNSAWTPWYFSHTRGGEHDLVRRTGAQLVLAFSAALGVASLVSPEALRLITRPAYWDGALVVPSLVIAGLFLLLFNLAANYAIFVRRTRLVLAVSAVGCLINVSLNLLLIPHWSIVGAAVASVAATGWLAIAMTVVSRVVLRAPNLPLVAIAGAVALAGACLLVSWLARDSFLVRAVLGVVLVLVAGATVGRWRRATPARDTAPTQAG